MVVTKPQGTKISWMVWVWYAFTILLMVGLLTGSLWLGTWKHEVLPTPRPSNPIELITVPNVVLSALLPVAIITVIQSLVTMTAVFKDACTLWVHKQLPTKPEAPEESVKATLLIDGGIKCCGCCILVASCMWCFSRSMCFIIIVSPYLGKMLGYYVF